MAGPFEGQLAHHVRPRAGADHYLLLTRQRSRDSAAQQYNRSISLQRAFDNCCGFADVKVVTVKRYLYVTPLGVLPV
jgi:hypothetical protein